MGLEVSTVLCAACYSCELGSIIGGKMAMLQKIIGTYICNPNHGYGFDPHVVDITVLDENGQAYSIGTRLVNDVKSEVFATCLECFPYFRLEQRHDNLAKLIKYKDRIWNHLDKFSEDEKVRRVEMFGARLLLLETILLEIEQQYTALQVSAKEP